MMKNVLDTDLTGKVAVVTGAGGVLCSQMAKVLARAGAKVALINRSEEAINQYAAEIIEEGEDFAAFMQADTHSLSSRVTFEAEKNFCHFSCVLTLSRS